MRYLTFYFVLLTLLLGGSSAKAALSMSANLYLTTYSLETPYDNEICEVRDNQVLGSFAAHTSGAYAIAVAEDIRTTGRYRGETGSQYALDGTYTGTDFPFSGFGPVLDGTTDLEHNYVADYYDGWLYQTSRKWSSARRLFPVGTAQEFSGVTYDFTDHSFWVSGFLLDEIRHFDMEGHFLGAFTTGGLFSTFLALDHGTGRLWLRDYRDADELYAFTKSGRRLGSIRVSGLGSRRAVGAEFGAVPEPRTGLALVFGILMAMPRHRRRFAPHRP
jgi:hypothetical protein